MKLYPLILVILIVGILPGCQDQNSLTVRLEEFYTYLDQPTLNDFKQKKLTPVTHYLDQKIKTDPAYSNRYQAIKKKEAINFFTTSQVVYYYYQYFYLPVTQKK